MNAESFCNYTFASFCLASLESPAFSMRILRLIPVLLIVEQTWKKQAQRVLRVDKLSQHLMEALK